ncbi:protoporphyrinogen oxidase [Neobacillus sp. D3-1R]|uniref:protoporphyrinogen oxidase n=1 Tax=Neobacillus sp. D3-1R TaxID=3445778 RepID=UPI003FA0121C
MKTILVIGGGVTGLSAMYKLHKWKKENKSDIRLILTEASEELGGKIRTKKANGFVMEAGADSIVARKANSLSFIEELGLEEEVVYNATGRSFIYTEGELKPIPTESVFGIPASMQSLVESTLVSAEGKVEALKDFYTKNETFTKNDSIGDFLEYFLGKELVEKQIAPVLSGVYSGDLKDLTIASTLPYVLEYKEEYGSILKGFEENKKKFIGGGDKKFFSFKNGLGRLIDAYEANLEDVEILKNTRVTNIKKTSNRYQVMLDNQDFIEADYVVLSIPHTAAEVLLDDQTVKAEFAQLKNSSLISIYMAFDAPDSMLPADGTGFITANSHDVVCNACTWTSRKWAHTSAGGNLLVRLFYKSSSAEYERLQQMGQEELLQVALHDINKSLGINAELLASEVTVWSESMPNYLITHPQSVKALENKMETIYPGIIIAGCSYYGVGIPDCIENGERTAKRITDLL